MKELVLSIPGYTINPPAGIPQGGMAKLPAITGVAYTLAMTAAVIVCLFVIIWGGFDWMFSQGDKQKVAKARDRLAFAVIGLIVVFLSSMIINILMGFFFG